MASESTVNSPSVSDSSNRSSENPLYIGPSVREQGSDLSWTGERTSAGMTSPKKLRLDAKGVAIVDDEEDLCSLFSLLIKNLGYRIDFVAHDGDEIVRAVSEKGIRPDLILMDYRMPILNGFQAAERIRQILPDVKIVVESADDTIKKEVISSGLYFIQKPFSMPTLAQTLRKVFEDPGKNPKQSS